MVVPIAVSQNAEHPVQGVQHPAIIDREVLANLNWDDIKIFLHVAEERSLRSAAAKSRVTVNTVRSRIARLEDKIGECLITRSHRGVDLTSAGLRLRQVARQMNGVAARDDFAESRFLRRPHELRIGTSEALGSGWLTPRLLDLQAQFPHLTMTMMCDNDLESDHSDDLDIQIVWGMPKNLNLIVSKLATLHFMPFASRDYVAEHGVPKTPEELLQHRFIEQVSPGIKSDLLDQLVGTERPPGFLPIRTNSSLAIYWAVANSAGIAFMPTFAPAVVDRLVAIDLPFQLKFDIYYCYHAESRASEIVMAGIEWLKQCFDPVIYPWFRSEFIHPNEFFPKASSNVIPLFSCLAPESAPDLRRGMAGET
jgi:DNA-binding transcriptional LysR family regulator